MKHITSLLLVLSITACAPSAMEQLRNADNSLLYKECRDLEGKKVEAVYIKWGNPKEIYNTGEYKVLVYKDYIRYKNILNEIRHDVFVKNGIIKICKLKQGYKRLY